VGTVRIETGFWTDLEQDPEVGDAAADLVLVFGTREQLCTRGLTDRLQAQHPQAAIAGCSTAGQFIGPDLTDDGVAITTVSFENSRVEMTARRMASAHHSDEVGRKIGASLSSPDLRAVLVLSDGTGCNGSALVEGLREELPADVTIFGGLAADGADFNETVVLSGGLVGAGVVAAVGFYGEALQIRTGSEGGWEQFGPERTITASEGAVLHRLDDEPALDLYSRDHHDGASPGLCIGVSCVGRRLVLGQRTDEELDAVIDALPADSVFTGFYSYGELAIGLSGQCELHNQTMTLTLISEQ